MTRWFLVIDNKVQPIPFVSRNDALDELDRIREKTYVTTWDIMQDDDNRLKAYNGITTPSATLGEIISLFKTIIWLGIMIMIWRLFNG